MNQGEVLPVESETIPGIVADDAWSLASAVCQESKIDSDQWYTIFPKINSRYIQCWRKQCQNVTRLEEEEWKDQIHREYNALAAEKRESGWRRFVYYKRCRHLRYLAILVSAAAVSYLCPQQTIYLLLRPAPEVWNCWYYVSTFVVLVGLPLVLALTLRAKKWSIRPNIQQLVASVIIVGLAVPLALLFATLFWQLNGGFHEWWSWAKTILAVPFCVCGSVAAIAEVFRWSTKRGSHPLEGSFTEESNANSALTIRDRVERRLTEFALEACRSSLMDEDAFQYETAEDIHNSLYVLWEDHPQREKNPEVALRETLNEFGPAANAVYTDNSMVRFLFYHRHRATRYLVMIGVGLFVVYILLMVITGADVSGRWHLLIRHDYIYFITTTSNGRDWIWALWSDNVLNSSFLALCVFLKARFARFQPWNHLLLLAAIWWFLELCTDVSVIVESCIARWNDWKLALCLSALSLVVCSALLCLVACALSEYFHPFPDKAVARARRWLGYFERRETVS